MKRLPKLFFFSLFLIAIGLIQLPSLVSAQCSGSGPAYVREFRCEFDGEGYSCPSSVSYNGSASCFFQYGACQHLDVFNNSSGCSFPNGGCQVNFQVDNLGTYTTSGCYEGGGGYPAPAYGNNYGTPYGYPYPYPYPYHYPYPYPAPSDLDVTSFYTADSGGSRSFNFAEGERIYWYTRVINDGSYYYQTDPGTVHMNLYQNQET
ncbi:MAG: hypothetical protein QG600_464, partial [Patescibacteria group bacterium]|nr:hypothetical protein [Patescibacteria group bacterium]